MAAARTFQDLDVWRLAHRWVLDIYHFSAAFPKEEMFGLRSQLRRAAVSIPANIAEGFKKTGRPDKARFYNIAQGSLEECRYYLILTRDLGYGDTELLAPQLDQIGRMLDAYRKAMMIAPITKLPSTVYRLPSDR